MLEEKLDIVLEKLHTTEDWSQRPIPEKWIDYAALDVEYLIELQKHITYRTKRK